MSLHRVPLPQLAAEGLRLHGLPIGTPSQLSDAFRHGMGWALTAVLNPAGTALCRLSDAQAIIDGLRGEIAHLRHGLKGDYDLDAWLDWCAERDQQAQPVAIIEYIGYEPSNSLRWLNSGLHSMAPGTKLYAAPAAPAARAGETVLPAAVALDTVDNPAEPNEALKAILALDAPTVGEPGITWDSTQPARPTEQPARRTVFEEVAAALGLQSSEEEDELDCSWLWAARLRWPRDTVVCRAEVAQSAIAVARRKVRKQRLKTCTALGERNKARDEVEAMSLLLQLAEHMLAGENFTSTGDVVDTTQADRDHVREQIQNYFQQRKEGQ